MLLDEGNEKDVASVVTQVVVDKNDPASLCQLEQPVGPFYSEEETKAEAERAERLFKEDAGRGWRGVVASPKLRWISRKSKQFVPLLNAGQVVVAAGGGVEFQSSRKTTVIWLVLKLLLIRTSLLPTLGGISRS